MDALNGFSVETLSSEVKEKLLHSMNNILFLADISIRISSVSAQLLDTICCGFFVFRNHDNLLACLVSFTHLALVLPCIEMVVRHFIAMYSSFLMTADYFKARIHFLIQRVRSLNGVNLNEQNADQVLVLYDLLIQEFSKQDYLLRHLLRNLVYFYCFKLTIIFFSYTIPAIHVLRACMAGISTFLVLGIMASGLNVGQVNKKTRDLYEELNVMAARSSVERKLSLKTRKRLLLSIKELGSLQVNGQFVVGLRDGSGPPTSSLEIVKLTFETVSLTLMMFSIFNF